MEELLERVLHASITGGIGVLIFYIFFRVFGKKCRAKARKTGWILIAFYLVFSFVIPKFEGVHTIEIPEVILYGKDGFGEADVLSTGKAEGNIKMPVLDKSSQKIMVIHMIFISWILLVTLLSIYNLIAYWITYHYNMRLSFRCKDKAIIKMAVKIAEETGLRKLPSLQIIKSGGRGPFTMGVVKKFIFIPDNISKEKEIQYILKHEMVHCKENDNFWKILFLAVHIIHWFNPLVWSLKRFAEQDMELVCDESVTRDVSALERKEYGKILIKYLEIQNRDTHKNSFSADYVAGKRFLERRFDRIFDQSTKRGGRGLVGSLVMVLLLLGGMTGIKIKGAIPLEDVAIQDFWEVVGEERNIWKFATGLEITYPEAWIGKIIRETDCWPNSAPSSNLLVVCEKMNAQEGGGGDLFYLSYDLYEGRDMVIMTGTVLGVYEQNGETYILTLSLPASLSYMEGIEKYRVAYEELSMQLDAVQINTDSMRGFTKCGIEDLEWLHNEKWLDPR